MFTSEFRQVGEIQLPPFTDTRVMMLPIFIGDKDSLPDFMSHYRWTAHRLFGMTSPVHHGKVGYLTVDEKVVETDQTHRRAGLHVDGGTSRGMDRGWGGGGRPWAANGMLTVSSHIGCRAWAQDFSGEPEEEGNCEHLRGQLTSDGTLLTPGVVYWLGALCVHESTPQPSPVRRQFVRLSMPSTAPWYDGYTENPLGVKPTGQILPRRVFMDI